MVAKMAAGLFGRARNYEWDGNYNCEYLQWYRDGHQKKQHSAYDVTDEEGELESRYSPSNHNTPRCAVGLLLRGFRQ